MRFRAMPKMFSSDIVTFSSSPTRGAKKSKSRQLQTVCGKIRKERPKLYAPVIRHISEYAASPLHRRASGLNKENRLHTHTHTSSLGFRCVASARVGACLCSLFLTWPFSNLSYRQQEMYDCVPYPHGSYSPIPSPNPQVGDESVKEQLEKQIDLCILSCDVLVA